MKRGMEAQMEGALRELDELRRQLFGATSDQLTPDQQSQMEEMAEDCQCHSGIRWFLPV